MSGVSKSSRAGPSLEQRWQAEIGDHVIALAWSPDGATVAAAAVGGPVMLCDGQTGRFRHVLPSWKWHGAEMWVPVWVPSDWICSRV